MPIQRRVLPTNEQPFDLVADPENSGTIPEDPNAPPPRTFSLSGLSLAPAPGDKPIQNEGPSSQSQGE